MSALPHALRPSPGKRVSIVLAVAVHLLLLAFLFYGIRWQNQTPEAIEVELVRAAPPSVVHVPPQVEPPPAIPAPEPRPEPQGETKPLPPPPKPDIALKEKEKPKPPPKEKPKPVPKELFKPVPKELPKPVPKEPSPVPFQKLLEQELQQTAARKAAETDAQELLQLKAAQAASARDKAIADYKGKIYRKIKKNIVLPPDLKGNPEAVFDVVQLPSGDILSASRKKSSGHAGYDAAVERAILKSSPLPKPEQGVPFERELKLIFRPLEE